jgi:molybdate transport system substrate-binding protein
MFECEGKLLLIQRRRVLSCLITGLLTTLLTLTSGWVIPLMAQQPTTLTISSGAGLRDVMLAIQQAYRKPAPNVKINYNFAASGVLRQQIEQGAPMDVALLASQVDMDALESQNLLLNDTRNNLLKSQIALIVPRQSSGITTFQDLAKSTIQRIVIGEPRTVPIGRFAQDVFTYFGITQKVQPKLIYAKSALEIISYVASGNVDAGITHDTSASQSSEVKIVAIAPEKSHSPVVYPVAVLRSSRNPDPARDFVQFLSTPTARSIFQKYGYTVMAPVAR